LEMARGTVLTLVRVTDCDALAVPTACLANNRLVAESVGAVSWPVPLRAMVCGELLALSVMVTAAVSGPCASGVKCP